MSNIEYVTCMLSNGATVLEKSPTAQIPRQIGRLLTQDALAKAAVALHLLYCAREDLGEMIPLVGGVSRNVVDIRAAWVSTLQGSTSPEATALLDKADNLVEGQHGAKKIVERGAEMDAKIVETVGLLTALVGSLEELDVLRATWQTEARAFVTDVAETAVDARLLAQSMGEQA
jgi:hypothetical protein